jgi:hypothetical protein
VACSRGGAPGVTWMVALERATHEGSARRMPLGGGARGEVEVG